VFDLDPMGLLRAAAALTAGRDLAGKPLRGAPNFCLGAVVSPSADDLERELARMEEKIEAGARFFQTQPVYDTNAFARFLERTAAYGVVVMAGFIVLKSGDMARRLNATLPGVDVPAWLIAELDAAPDKAAKSAEIAGRIIGELKGVCRGVHIMAIGWEEHIPAILSAAGIAPGPARATA